MGKLDYLFMPGKVFLSGDGGAGSSGKAKMSSYIAENADNWTFACNTFAPQAGHWAVLNDGRKYFYQTLNSCAYLADKYEKIYIGPGAMIELPAFFREMEENKIPRHKIGISPAVAILQDKDAAFERGEVDLDGSVYVDSSGKIKGRIESGTSMKGSTCHGVGVCSVRKILRRKDALYAKDVKELSEFICNVPEEIMARLNRGEAGFGEIAQGFQLSLNHQYFLGYTTSRNVTAAQFMSDMFLSPKYLGHILMNFRTYPIRINSNKYVGKDGRFLTNSEIQSGIPHEVFRGNSGPWYPDQEELTWDQITEMSGSHGKIQEVTSVTKLLRRVATFSQMNLDETIRYNDTGHKFYITINFMNYVDASVLGKSGGKEVLTPKCLDWIQHNVSPVLSKYNNTGLLLIGTGPRTNDVVLYNE